MNTIRLVALTFLTVSIGVVQADAVFTLVTPVSEIAQLSAVTAPEAQYSGEKISVNFKDTPITVALQIIADYSGARMVVSESVTGNVTLNLDNVPWDQALDLILESKGLSKRITADNVILIAPSEEIDAREHMSAI